MQELACTSTSSSITTGAGCGILCQCPSAVFANPNPSAPITTPFSESPRKGQIRILGPQHGCGNRRRILSNNHRGGLGGTRCGGVLRIRYEGEFPWSGLFDPVKPGNFSFRRAVFQTCVESRSDSRKF